MAQAEQVELLVACLEQRELHQPTGERQRRVLDLRGHLPGLRLRIVGVPDVVQRYFQFRVVERLLEDLAVGFEEGGTRRLGLLQGLPDGLLQESMIDDTVDLAQEAELPLGAGQSALVREPDVQLPARQR